MSTLSLPIASSKSMLPDISCALRRCWALSVFGRFGLKDLLCFRCEVWDSSPHDSSPSHQTRSFRGGSGYPKGTPRHRNRKPRWAQRSLLVSGFGTTEALTPEVGLKHSESKVQSKPKTMRPCKPSCEAPCLKLFVGLLFSRCSRQSLGQADARKYQLQVPTSGLAEIDLE